MPTYGRRKFLELSASGAASVVALRNPFGQHVADQAPPVLVRRNIKNLTAGSEAIRSYERAIARMKALPADDPLSWSFQAAIHRTVTTPARAEWNQCQHENPRFWPWHRMYLYYFERIIRQMSGDPNWTIPYWDYADPTQRRLPVAFRDPSSELFAPRGLWNAPGGFGPSFYQSDVVNTIGFETESFHQATAWLEVTPHNVVHNRIGGWMADPATAALDPIFWVHHSNIDRIWNRWLAQGGRYNPTTTTAWADAEYTFFDERRRRVTVTPCDVLRASQQLGYRYEGEPAQVNQFCGRPERLFREEVLAHWPQPLQLGPTRTALPPLDVGRIASRLRVIAERPAQSLFLILDGVTAARQPGTVWQVFLSEPTKTRPDAKGPSLIGNLALFGTGIRNQGHHFRPARFVYKVDRAVATTLARDRSSLTLTFVPTGLLVKGKSLPPRVASTVRIGKVTLLASTRRP